MYIYIYIHIHTQGPALPHAAGGPTEGWPKGAASAVSAAAVVRDPCDTRTCLWSTYSCMVFR